MVVWNSTPVTESVYLGEGVRQIDLWGRAAARSTPTGRQAKNSSSPSINSRRSSRA